MHVKKHVLNVKISSPCTCRHTYFRILNEALYFITLDKVRN